MISESTGIVAVPYRDIWFQNRYGVSVRDLYMLHALASMVTTGIVAIARPRVLWDGRDFFKSGSGLASDSRQPSLQWHVTRSIDALLSMQGRAWTQHAYEALVRECVQAQLSRYDRVVLLDWHPIALMPSDVLQDSRVFYHHDVIDNFSKHVRFNKREKDLVAKKRAQVQARARLVTTVTRSAAESYLGSNVVPMENGVSRSDISPIPTKDAKYDFGLLGFIDKKTNVGFLRRISELGYSVLVAGEVYDKEIGDQLAAMPGIHLHGRYSSDDVPNLCRQFRAGLVAYDARYLHDGSPTKLFRYLAAGRPVLSNLRTDLESSYVTYVDSASDDSVTQFVSRCRASLESDEATVTQAACDSLPPEWIWENRVRMIGSLYAQA